MTKEVSNNDIMEALARFADSVEKRFDGVDSRFDKVEARLDGVETRLGGLESEVRDIRLTLRDINERLERIEGRVDGIESDIEEIYDRIVALEKLHRKRGLKKDEKAELEAKFADLMVWAKKVSKQLGIPLPKL